MTLGLSIFSCFGVYIAFGSIALKYYKAPLTIASFFSMPPAAWLFGVLGLGCMGVGIVVPWKFNILIRDIVMRCSFFSFSLFFAPCGGYFFLRILWTVRILFAV